ncbi:ATP-binding cassette domain-containing protein [Corynebacterium freiburgense]|uniref:ATP-binding cassette domain-containing protein n=1 Tax=Corynebacterium freiburgense TaxID=556548 RepID=UPI000687FB70|nr:ATP-binding cassette domain-containing protein [Corynebacterium freiburgense]WJZ01526.1 Autoinducer 2 import ATP-binding protein LsrA [Corynebacterium freiburgense]
MIELVGVEVGYGNKSVLYEISFRAEIGRCYVLAGANGSGKTTLLKAIVGLIPVKKGLIYFGSEQVKGIPRIAGKIGIALGPEMLPKMLTVSQIINLKGSLAEVSIKSAEEVRSMPGSKFHLCDRP